MRTNSGTLICARPECSNLPMAPAAPHQNWSLLAAGNGNDLLELIERYVAPGYGLGISVRLPDKGLSSKVKAIELPGLPPVKLGLLRRGESTVESKIGRACFEEVKRQAAWFRGACFR